MFPELNELLSELSGAPGSSSRTVIDEVFGNNGEPKTRVLVKGAGSCKR